MNTVSSLTVELNECIVTVQRRTVLSDARYQALLLKVAPFLGKIVQAVETDSAIVDTALTRYLRLVSQLTVNHSASRLPIVTLSDDEETIVACCVTYLTDLDPALMTAWADAMQAVDASWNPPELTPTPPEKLPKNA